jgi:hypothetical protein
MIQPYELPSPQQQKFLTRPSKKIADDIMVMLYLTGLVPEHHLNDIMGR